MGMDVSVNYLAVVVAAIAAMVVGSIWYSPALFGKMMMKEAGLDTPEKIAAAKKGMGKAYAMQAVASLVAAWVLAWIMGALKLSGAVGGLQAAFWTWLGFTATAMVGQMAWEKKGLSWFWVNGVGILACAIGSGVVLGLWK